MRAGVVAYQGAPGAFSETAARKFAGADAALHACPDFQSLFSLVVDGQVRWGVVPVENSLAGPVTTCTTLLKATSVVIAAEMHMPISLALIAAAPVTLSTLTHVYSHPMALAQCRAFFRRHSQLTALPSYDTAGAVQRITRVGDPRCAAIAAARCAHLYGGTLLADGVETGRKSVTRFLLIQPRTGRLGRS